jgi:myosin-1
LKLKQKILFQNLSSVSVSSLSDELFVLHTESENKSGQPVKSDWIYVAEHVIELLVHLSTVNNSTSINFADNNTIACNVSTTKQVHIDFDTVAQSTTSGQVIRKASKQRLSVIVPLQG